MALPITRISLEFEDNGRFHDDLVLHIGDESWRCDSYYLALDQGLLPDREDAGKVAVVLERLLQQWRQAAESLPDGGTCFLPYDFSDQYTAFLRCVAVGSHLLVQRVWAEIEGWSISPSRIGELLHGITGAQDDGPIYQIPREAFLCPLRSGRRIA